MSLVQRADRFKGTGKIVSIEPSTGTPLTQLDSYLITSTGRPASVIHAQNPIHKPGTTTNIDANATFFEPNESYGQDGVPRFSQLVIDGQLTAGSVKVSEYNEYFTVTDPGVMTTQGFFAQASSSGAAVRVPSATSQPQTYRRKGLVEVFLTTSNDADAEVAYNDDNVNWCAISFVTFYSDLVKNTASVSGSYRTFNKYLVGSGASDTASAGTLGVYSASSTSTATGDTSYTTTGIFRSKVVPFMRQPDGTQLYLKTNVTFS